MSSRGVPWHAAWRGAVPHVIPPECPQACSPASPCQRSRSRSLRHGAGRVRCRRWHDRRLPVLRSPRAGARPHPRNLTLLGRHGRFFPRPKSTNDNGKPQSRCRSPMRLSQGRFPRLDVLPRLRPASQLAPAIIPKLWYANPEEASSDWPDWVWLTGSQARTQPRFGWR